MYNDTSEFIRESAPLELYCNFHCVEYRHVILNLWSHKGPQEFMLDLMYEIPRDDNIGRVTVTKEYVLHEGGPLIELRGMSRQPLYIGQFG